MTEIFVLHAHERSSASFDFTQCLPLANYATAPAQSSANCVVIFTMCTTLASCAHSLHVCVYVCLLVCMCVCVLFVAVEAWRVR
jgi:hypothetical protein